MPLYDYECATHGLFEAHRRMSKSSDPAPCPRCERPSPRAYVQFPGFRRVHNWADENNGKGRYIGQMADCIDDPKAYYRSRDEVVEDCKKKGYRYSFDMLGEGARTEEHALRYHQRYLEAIAATAAKRQDGSIEEVDGVSVKLSALHPRYLAVKEDEVMTVLYPRILEQCEAAAKADIALCLDAEESDRLVIQMKVLERLAREPSLKDWGGLGLAVQAYQKRCRPLLEKLVELGKQTNRRFLVRLVKGAYWDTEIKWAQAGGHPDFPVWSTKPATDLNFLACARVMLNAPDAIYPQFATHNAHTLCSVRELAQEAGDPPYEFQRLHGMGEPLYAAAAEQYGEDLGPVRIYAPVGSHQDLLPYLVRRLLENGANTSFVHAFLDDDVPAEDVARGPFSMAPVLDRHPFIPAPPALYGEARLNSAGVDLTQGSVRERLQAAQEAFDKGAPYKAGVIIDGEAFADGGEARKSPADLSFTVAEVRDAEPGDEAESEPEDGADDALARDAEPVAVVGPGDERPDEFPEVVVELPGVGHPDRGPERRERRLVLRGVPERLQDGEPRLVAEQRERLVRRQFLATPRGLRAVRAARIVRATRIVRVVHARAPAPAHITVSPSATVERGAVSRRRVGLVRDVLQEGVRLDREPLPGEEGGDVPAVAFEELAGVRVVDRDGLPEVDDVQFALVDHEVVLAQVAVDEAGVVEPPHVLADDLERGLGVLDVDLREAAAALVVRADVLHDEDVPLGRDGGRDPDAGLLRAAQVGELLAGPREHDLLLVRPDTLEPRVAVEVRPHLPEVAGVDAVYLHRDRAVRAERLVDAGLLPGRERAAERVDVAVLDELVDGGERRVVEHRALDLELVGVLQAFTELEELAVAGPRDAVGLVVGDVDLLPLVADALDGLDVEQAELLAHRRASVREERRGEPGGRARVMSSLDVSLLAELVGVGLLVAPDDVGLLVLPVPRLDEHDVVLPDPDPFLHAARDARGPRLSVHAPYPDAVRAEHALDDGEHLVLVRHPEVLPVVAVAHERPLHGETVKCCKAAEPSQGAA